MDIIYLCATQNVFMYIYFSNVFFFLSFADFFVKKNERTNAVAPENGRSWNGFVWQRQKCWLAPQQVNSVVQVIDEGTLLNGFG